MAVSAVFFDALGTLVALEPPAPRLAELLRVPFDAQTEAAVRAEMTYYRDHAHEGRDAASLAGLRLRCAEIVSTALDAEVSAETLMQAIQFTAYQDARPALLSMRSLGITTVCVSNWDYALPEVLDRVGLGDLLHGVVTSAEAGAQKPDPAIFEQALRLAECAPGEALHVGDTADEDLVGATAAGIPSMLVVRESGGDVPPAEATVIHSLSEIGHHLVE